MQTSIASLSTANAYQGQAMQVSQMSQAPKVAQTPQVSRNMAQSYVANPTATLGNNVNIKC